MPALRLTSFLRAALLSVGVLLGASCTGIVLAQPERDALAQAPALEDPAEGVDVQGVPSEPDSPSLAVLRAEAHRAPEDPDVWLNLGNAYLASDRYNLASEAFLEAVALDYTFGDAHFGLGLAEFGRGEYEAALFAFNEVTRLYPGRFDGHFNRGVTLNRLDRPVDAAQAFQEAVETASPETLPGERAQALVALAAELSRAGDYSGAADAYAQALEEDPAGEFGDPYELRFLWAQALYRSGLGLEAMPQLTELEAAGTDYRVNALIAQIYLDAGQSDYAAAALERGIRRAGNAGEQEVQANLLVRLGLLQRSAGRFAEAVESFSRAAQLSPGMWEAHYNLGLTQLDQGRLEAAAESLEQALQTGTEAPAASAPGQQEDTRASRARVLLALAAVYEQLGEAGAAVRTAEQAVDLAPGDEQVNHGALHVIGRVQYRSGEFETALETFGRLVSMNPQDLQAHLWAGLAAYQGQLYGTAVLHYEAVLAENPDDYQARYNLAAAYLAAGRYGDAEVQYRQLIQQDPAQAASHYQLGWALLSQNRREEARSAWQRSSEMGYAPAAQALSTYF